MLKIARNECHQLLQQNKMKELETHLKTFEEQFEKLNNLKSKVQELMLEEDEGIDYIEDIVQEDDAPIEELQNRIKELKEGKNEKIKADQTEEERLQRRHDEEKRLETIRLTFKKQFRVSQRWSTSKQRCESDNF